MKNFSLQLRMLISEISVFYLYFSETGRMRKIYELVEQNILNILWYTIAIKPIISYLFDQ